LAAGGFLLLGSLMLWQWMSEPTVTGTVTLDGQLLQRGSVTLIPVNDKGDSEGPGALGRINTQGNYEIKQGLRAGKYRIEIQSARTISGKKVRNPTIPSHFVEEEVSVVPEEYNTKSTLIRQVRRGANVLDFDLKTTARR
jgi:hypothetical protein